jgi:hypothetical protein
LHKLSTVGLLGVEGSKQARFSLVVPPSRQAGTSSVTFGFALVYPRA